jgi:hypothetical protein
MGQGQRSDGPGLAHDPQRGCERRPQVCAPRRRDRRGFGRGILRPFWNGARQFAICVLPLHHVSGFMAWMRSALTGGPSSLWNWKEARGGHGSPGCPEAASRSCPTQLQRLLASPRRWRGSAGFGSSLSAAARPGRDCSTWRPGWSFPSRRATGRPRRRPWSQPSGRGVPWRHAGMRLPASPRADRHGRRRRPGDRGVRLQGLLPGHHAGAEVDIRRPRDPSAPTAAWSSWDGATTSS